MSDSVVRTIYGSYLQTCLLLKLNYTMVANSTLNEKFNVQAGVAPSNTEIPSVKYLAIGNGGHKYVMGPDNIPYAVPYQHRARDAALFNHLPFILRTTDNDLTAAQRNNYAMRVTETHNSVQYYAYYLKRIDMSAVTAAMQYNTVSNGTTVISSFTPTSGDLNPTQPDLTSTGVNSTTGDYIDTSAILNLTMTPDDVNELLNVATIIYGNAALAIISELALCSGIDKLVLGNVPSGTFNYQEAIAAQVHSFVSTNIPLQSFTVGYTATMDVGATEPLGYSTSV